MTMHKYHNTNNTNDSNFSVSVTYLTWPLTEQLSKELSTDQTTLIFWEYQR